MSPHMQDSITTPFFMFNSKFDAWQLEWGELQLGGSDKGGNWGTPAEQKGVLQ